MSDDTDQKLSRRELRKQRDEERTRAKEEKLRQKLEDIKTKNAQKARIQTLKDQISYADGSAARKKQRQESMQKAGAKIKEGISKVQEKNRSTSPIISTTKKRNSPTPPKKRKRVVYEEPPTRMNDLLTVRQSTESDLLSSRKSSKKSSFDDMFGLWKHYQIGNLFFENK